MATRTKDDDRALRQAVLQMESVREMVAALKAADDGDDEGAREDARTRIQEDALSVEVRDAWYSPGGERGEPEEYAILLCTGGPAVRIVGELGRYNEPASAEIEYQDWGTPWTALTPSLYADGDEDALIVYASQFLGF